jgi:hypothetical protein
MEEPAHDQTGRSERVGLSSLSQVIENLLNRAAEARARAAEAADPSLRQLHQATATAYEQWALKMQPIADLQSQIERKAEAIRHRFSLPNSGDLS